MTCFLLLIVTRAIGTYQIKQGDMDLFLKSTEEPGDFLNLTG